MSFVCIGRLLEHLKIACVVQQQAVLTEHADIESQFYDLEARLTQLARHKNSEIEDYLNDCRKGESGVMKILLLGGPACGKSTIFKQMRILHQGGFKDPNQLEYFADLIHRNVFEVFKQLVAGALQNRISFGEYKNLMEQIQRRYGNYIDINDRNCNPNLPINYKLTRVMTDLLKRFWSCPPIREAYRRRYSYELNDSAKYYFDRLDHLCDPYVPNEEDILHSREATGHIHHQTFKYNNVMLSHARLVDVGGQKSQRRKWLHLFDDVRVVLFIVDLTGYTKEDTDERMDERTLNKTRKAIEETDNQEMNMVTSLRIFKDVATNRLLRRAIFLLFLNKKDLFDEIVETVPISECFRSYEGENSPSESLAYIRRRFLAAAHPRKSVFPHITTAVCTENVKVVFQGCMESVFKQSTRATGLI